MPDADSTSQVVVHLDHFTVHLVVTPCDLQRAYPAEAFGEAALPPVAKALHAAERRHSEALLVHEDHQDAAAAQAWEASRR